MGKAFLTGTSTFRIYRHGLQTAREFHNAGVSWGTDLGRFEVTRHPDDRGRFKTPSLRNVAITAPFMHDGSLATLDAVIEFYDRGAGANPNLDGWLRPLALSRQALTAFLPRAHRVGVSEGGHLSAQLIHEAG